MSDKREKEIMLRDSQNQISPALVRSLATRSRASHFSEKTKAKLTFEVLESESEVQDSEI